MDSPAKRLEDLLDGILDDSCSDAQREEFAQLVDEQRQLAPELVEQLRVHSLLQWNAQGIKVPIAPSPIIAPGAAESPEAAAAATWPTILRFFALGATGKRSLPVPKCERIWNDKARPDAHGQTSLARGARWLGAAAAIALVAFGIANWRPADPVPETDPSVAQIIDQHLVEWSDETTALVDEKLVVPGLLKIKSGELTLQFRSGATVSANGDVSMLIESDMLVRLDRGQATANVPQWAKGFTIRTPDVEVIDLGTKFGVVARGSGSTDVVVFEGKVDVKPTFTTAGFQKSLAQGEGVRVSTQGAMNRIYEVRHDSAGGGWTTDEPEASETTFKTIRDNIPSAEVPTYYQITRNGFAEDSQAYVDRHPHQWNGLTSDGLPKFLLGADYVRTCNDYRYINEFEMIVELARPAMLYVLFDDRVKAPAWLAEQFEDTGADIGLDEGPARPGTMHLSNAVGPGQSIDQVFSVWRRRCERPESIRLGAMGPQPGARAMYGIAAKPLD